MSPLLFVYTSLCGFFAFAAIYHLILWFSSRRETLLAVFSLDCALRVVFGVVLVWVMTATTPAEAGSALTIRLGLGMLLVVTWLWSLSLLTGVRPRWFVWPVTILFIVLVLVQAFVFQLNPAVLSIEQLALPWGETVTVTRPGPVSWWFVPLFVVAAAVEIFGLWCGAHLWRRDRVAGALIILSTCGRLALLLLDALRGAGILLIPVIAGLPHVLSVCALAILIAREHRHTRERLAASDRRYHGIFDQTFQFMDLLKTDGTLIEANRTALEFAGVQQDDVAGKPLWQTPWWTHSPELQGRVREAIREAASGATVRFEATHPRPDGRLVDVDVSIKPIRDDAGRVVLLIPEARDITERKEEEEKRRLLEAQLAQSQRVEAVGQLAGGVAHDFNNLLTVIIGDCQLVQSLTPPDDERFAMLTDIRDAGERAAALTRQLLTFGRRQVVAASILDLNTVVVDTEQLLRRLIGEDIRLVSVLRPGLPRVTADPGQIGQVIMNLAVNARDAMPTGGQLTIETDCVEVNDNATTHPGMLPGRYVRLIVTDTGAGIAPDVQARIFEPFFTTKGPGKGTGLGLATARTIAEQSLGYLFVESGLGRGATFYLYLPASNAPVPEGTTELATKPGHGTETILVVEDEKAVRQLTCQMLRGFGYTVIEAAGGVDAIRIVEQQRGPIELLVTDVVMPDMNGPKLVECLMRLLPRLKALYLSGYTDDAVVRYGVLQAEVAFLQKPFTVNSLARKVRQTLDGPPPRSLEAL